MIEQMTHSPRHLAEPAEAKPVVSTGRHRAPDVPIGELFQTIGQRDRAAHLKPTRPIDQLPLPAQVPDSSLSTPDALVFTVGNRTALREILALEEMYAIPAMQEPYRQEREATKKLHRIRAFGAAVVWLFASSRDAIRNRSADPAMSYPF